MSGLSDKYGKNDGEWFAHLPASPEKLLLEKISSLGFMQWKKQRVLEWQDGILEILLNVAEGNRGRLARLIGIDRSNLLRMIRKSGRKNCFKKWRTSNKQQTGE